MMEIISTHDRFSLKNLILESKQDDKKLGGNYEGMYFIWKFKKQQ